jgi:hypothetical protein
MNNPFDLPGPFHKNRKTAIGGPLHNLVVGLIRKVNIAFRVNGWALRKKKLGGHKNRERFLSPRRLIGLLRKHSK